MKPIHEAKKMFTEIGLNFEEELSSYLVHGFVISYPDKFIMARPIEAKRQDLTWDHPNPDCWYIHCVVGQNCFKWFLDQDPYKLPYVAWRRNNCKESKFRVYNASTFGRFSQMKTL
jgi:hypothetical protein